MLVEISKHSLIIEADKTPVKVFLMGVPIATGIARTGETRARVRTLTSMELSRWSSSAGSAIDVMPIEDSIHGAGDRLDNI